MERLRTPVLLSVGILLMAGFAAAQETRAAGCGSASREQTETHTSAEPTRPAGPHVPIDLVGDRVLRRQQGPFILTNLESPPEIASQHDRLGVEPSLIMYQGRFDPDETGTWARPDLTDRWLEEHVREDYDGFLTLDWEDGVMPHLRAGPSDPEFESVVSEMVRLITYVKQARPHAKVGYYRIPPNEYWRQDDVWREAVRATKPICDASDALFPSVYDHSPADPGRDHARYAALVQLSLELAEGKPVLLYTYHRYLDDHAPHGYRLIDRDEYVEQIRHLMGVDHEGVRPAGVVAWGAERHQHEAAFATDDEGWYVRTDARWDRLRRAFTEELLPGETADEYILRLHSYVYCLLGEAVYGRECERTGP